MSNRCLVDRQLRVKIADSYSTFSKISNGGPQGSIFAVFLFSVYINDLPDQLNNKTFLYADDTKIIGQISERAKFQFDINRAIEWSGSNKLKFNFDKFSILEFSYNITYNSSTELFAKGIAIKNEKQRSRINFYSQHDLELSSRKGGKEKFSKTESFKKSYTQHHKRNCQMHVGENIYFLCGLLCVKCLEPRTTLSSTLRKTAEIMFKMDNLPFCSG